MKRFLCFLIVALMLPAMCLADEGSPADDTYVFRDKITWGMNETQIAEIEGKGYNDSVFDYFKQIQYSGVTIGKLDAYLNYFFYSDYLVMCVYAFRDEGQNLDYLRKAFSEKYGEGKEVSGLLVYQLLSKIYAAGVSENDYSDVPTWKWSTLDGTVIYLMSVNNGITAYYVSPVFIADELYSLIDEELPITGI